MYVGRINSNNWFRVWNRACKTLLVWLVIFAQIAALSTFPTRANAFVPAAAAGANFVAANISRAILQNLMKRGFDAAAEKTRNTFLFTAAGGIAWLTAKHNYQGGQQWMDVYCKLKGPGFTFLLSDNGITGECRSGSVEIQIAGSNPVEVGPSYFSTVDQLPRVPLSFSQNLVVNPGAFNDTLFAITDNSGKPVYPIRVKRVRYSCLTSGDWCSSVNSTETVIYDMDPTFSQVVTSSTAPRWRFRSFLRNKYTSKNAEGKRSVDYELEYWYQKTNSGNTRDYFETPFEPTLIYSNLLNVIPENTLVQVNDNGKLRNFIRKNYVCEPGAYPCQVTTLPGYQSDLNFDLSAKFSGPYNGTISHYANRFRKDDSGTSTHIHLFEFVPGSDGKLPGLQTRKIILPTTRPLTAEEEQEAQEALRQPLKKGFISPLADDAYDHVSTDPERIPRDRNVPVEEPGEYIIEEPQVVRIFEPVPTEDPAWQYPDTEPSPPPEGTTCPSGTYYDRGMGRCVPQTSTETPNCPAGTYYDSTARACRDIPEDGTQPFDPGPYPDNPFPTLETPEIKPFYDDLLNFLKGSGPPAFTGDCPTATFYFQENPIELNKHCELADQYSPIMRIAFLALSTITAFLIVLSA